MSDVEKLAQQERDLQKQLNETKRAKFRAQAAAKREEGRAKLAPDAVKTEDDFDALTAKVFNNEDGSRFLFEYLKPRRPVVFDEICERLQRVAPPGARVITAEENAADPST